MRQRLILDCTLRDGGLGFEDVSRTNERFPYFTDEVKMHLGDKLTAAGLDIVELGSIKTTKDDGKKFAIYEDVEQISKVIPLKASSEQLFAALYTGPDISLEQIPEWREGLCKGARVILRYSELRKSLEFCKGLAQKGYWVFVQPMLTMRYTESEIQLILDAANAMSAFAVYFVDSYGYMCADDVKRFFARYNKVLNPNIKIGLHAHNNRNLAFSNALTLLSQESDRDIIVDSCIMGLGQGAGNLQTEIIADYYISEFQKNYDYGCILDACDLIDRYWTANTWGYSVTNFIPTRHKAAYKYAIAMRNLYHMSYREMDQIFSEMTYELKQRFTDEALIKVLKSSVTGRRYI